MPDVKCVLIHDNFQNFKSYNIPKAQLVIADIPYNIGTDFYASRPDWYVDGDNKNGESSKARKAAFNTDFTFNIAEYFHFCNRLLKKEPGTGEKDAPCMIVFCAFQQIPKVITEAEKYGFKNYIPLVFCKNYSPQVLKANMKIVGATEYALVLYRGMQPRNITMNAMKTGVLRICRFSLSSGNCWYTIQRSRSSMFCANCSAARNLIMW